MKYSVCSTAIAAAVAITTGLGTSSAYASPVNMAWSTVGNAGNAADPTTGFGAVGYEYRIGTYEVTNAQYSAFLNAVAASDPNGLYNTNLNNSARGGITRLGSSGSYTYSVKPNMGDKPVHFVSWFNAARMANWMTNGQGSGGTENGVYELDGTYSLVGITRDLSNPNQVFLPTEDEWYKAAYHQPFDQGGDVDDYWRYATRSNLIPMYATATATGDVANPGPNVANYDNEARWNGSNGNVTTVGSAGNATFYGAFDMNGNASEWCETLVNNVRIHRGGAYNNFLDFPNDFMESAARFAWSPEGRQPGFGFRLASPIPAPASAALFGFVGLAAARRRRR